MQIEVYSDGSATTADKPGGWAWVIVIDGQKYSEGSGHVESATNNDMELEAAIQGLSAAFKFVSESNAFGLGGNLIYMPAGVATLVSDSQLILGWSDGTYQFKQQDKMEKYTQLRRWMVALNASTRWVKGHSGDEHNERCDKLAKEARTGLSKKHAKEEAMTSGKTLIGHKKVGTICLWYKNALRVIDLDNNIIEEYNRDVHGTRGAFLEIREEKSR